jgi:hypothetical protein
MKASKIIYLVYYYLMGGGSNKIVFLIIVALGVFAVNNTAGYKQRLSERNSSSVSPSSKENKRNSTSDQGNTSQGSTSQNKADSQQKDAKIPKQLYGLTNNGNGQWVYDNGQLAYDQARVYAGAGVNNGKYPPGPVKTADDCQYQKNEIIQVKVDSNKYPASALHFYLSWRRGAPRITTVGDKGVNIRNISLAGIPTKPGLDRDEVNLNATWEAQYDAAQSKKKAEASGDKVIGRSDIAWIPLSDNRGSGSSIGSQISDYCTGQRFKINLVPAV